jgi:hypothetical protein
LLERLFLCINEQTEIFRECAREGKEERSQREGAGCFTALESVISDGGFCRLRRRISPASRRFGWGRKRENEKRRPGI